MLAGAPLPALGFVSDWAGRSAVLAKRRGVGKGIGERDMAAEVVSARTPREASPDGANPDRASRTRYTRRRFRPTPCGGIPSPVLASQIVPSTQAV